MASTDTEANDSGGGMHPREDERDRRRSRIGLVLVVIGALALISDLGIFRGWHNIVGMAIFAVLGGFALNHYMRRRRVGSLIGAFVLFGLAAATVGGAAAGFYFLGLIGAGFVAVYYVDRSRWWAIIPAGALFSLAIVAGLDSWAPGYDAGWILFAGLALTFGVLYRLPEDPRPWAVYPAIACVVLAVLGLSFGGSWLVPLVLVAIGVYMLLRQNDRGREPQAAAGGEAQGGAPGGDVQAEADVQAGGEPAAPGTAEGGAAEGEGDEGRS